mgnify:CR=1 FL=1
MSNTEDNIDINGDGKVTKAEEQAYERRAVNRRRMAWVSLVSMLVFMPHVSACLKPHGGQQRHVLFH